MNNSDAAGLRKRAEEKAAESPKETEPLSPAATRLTLHELRVHQIELEMQNEELRRAQAELDAARARYFDLYDLAPVGYVTVSETGMILEGNLTLSTLLGVTCSTLANRLFSRFIPKEAVDSYYLFRKKLFATGEPQSCELQMVKNDGAPFWAHLEATAAQDAEGKPVSRIVLSDITERKQTEAFRDMNLKALQILNRPDGLYESIRSVLAFMKTQTGTDAVGLRLQDGEDFPYFAQQGFSEDFLLTENSLAERGPDGGVCRDRAGKVCLECTCGLVISGKTDPSHPLFTRAGSFWTNDSAPLLDLPPDQDPRHHPRNECIHLGYASVALIPVRDKERIVGLLHLNDRRKGFFTLASVNILEDIAALIGTALMRKRAEDALRNAERNLRSTVDGLSAHIAVIDESGEIILTNKSYSDFAERNEIEPRAVSEGTNYLAVCDTASGGHSEEAKPFAKGIREVLSGKRQSFELEYPCHSPDEKRWFIGRVTPFAGEGPRRVIVAHENITERKQAEAKLRESEAYVRAILDSLPIGIAVNSIDDAVNFNYLNDNFLRFYRTTRERLTDADAFWNAVYEDPDFREEIKARVLADCASRDPSRMHWENIPITRAGSETRYISAMNTPIPDRPLMISAVWDVTERKRTEEELHKIDKLQSVGALAGGIAHDFNNVLLGLFGNISIAMEDLAKDHPSYAPLADAEKSMTRAVRLTKQLLTFAKGGDPVKEHVSLGAMAEEVARFDLTGSNVSLVCHHDADLWPVDADRGQIQQVVSNLVINARQAMPSGGHLHVTLENADLPAEAIPALRPGRYVKVSIRDEGGGIEPKVIGQIFDPYFSTKQTGSGLGLATVWSIINKHGGHIGVESEVSKGATFTFYLPASSARLSAEEESSSAEIPSPTSPAKILVMDDEKMVCDLASKMLTHSGHSVATAPDGQEAIAFYRQALDAGAPFDLVIMDLTIPGGPGGKEVIQDLLALDPSVRAIVSSGYAEDPIMANPAAYGFKGTVAKPYTAKALREAVARVLT